MAIIGFVALVLIGLYFLLSGLALMACGQAFGGKIIGWEAAPFLIGVALLVLAFVYSPFSVTFTE